MYSISEDIWSRKYRYMGSEEEGIPADESIEATMKRVAKAIASGESKKVYLQDG